MRVVTAGRCRRTAIICGLWTTRKRCRRSAYRCRAWGSSSAGIGRSSIWAARAQDIDHRRSGGRRTRGPSRTSRSRSFRSSRSPRSGRSSTRSRPSAIRTCCRFPTSSRTRPDWRWRARGRAVADWSNWSVAEGCCRWARRSPWCCRSRPHWPSFIGPRSGTAGCAPRRSGSMRAAGRCSAPRRSASPSPRWPGRAPWAVPTWLPRCCARPASGRPVPRRTSSPWPRWRCSA